MPTTDGATPQIQAQHVSFAPNVFKSRQFKRRDLAQLPPNYILRDLSFAIAPGDRVAIVGASGSGKTTLLRLLNRLSEPTDGHLEFHQKPYAHIRATELRQRIVLVLQETKLLGMTVQEALTYPLKLQSLPPQEIQSRLQTHLEHLRIPTEWLGRTELQLSVGQRQLVAIARALMLRPQVLLLDEPTSALDVGRTDLVLNVLTELNQRDHLTVLMVNHQLEQVQQFANRVLMLQQGSLCRDQPTTAIPWPDVEHQLKTDEAQLATEWDEA